MAKNKMTKAQRHEQVEKLVHAMFRTLIALTKDAMTRWGNRADELSTGLSKTAIKRAQRRANKMSDQHPPGALKATEAMDIFEELCNRYDVSKGDRATLWGAVAQFCMFQLAVKSGPFFNAALDFRVVEPADEDDGMDDLNEMIVGRAGKCDCAKCRPRKPEELN